MNSVPTNKDRAQWAEKALRYYVKRVKKDASHPDDFPDEIVDLMCDLLHLGKSKGLKPNDLVRRAQMHFSTDEWEEKRDA